ncbi:CRISPR-associated protein Cmr3 [Paenibacillus shirakamiensis]|uniref:CRISPR-associated protein Cmr3 n=1 Tax=Paenibacillus shirakamiensis TaxID=1265935 RepID=A0ABS4JBL0_9BACL|nr:type III-B CRISPR module-associated protein Cmr3 [Paenibacillus shirakamiensis]MBP1999088.1 CRISPR-associated protein Cmr3 [Paenibacillus shirakamiensis]
MIKWLQATPLDPLMIRDGRPFNRTPGIRAYTLNDVTPSVMAGTIRTMLAKRRQHELGQASPLSYFSKLIIRGPLHRWRGNLYFPMPQDAEFFEDEDQVRLQCIVPIRPERLEEDGLGFYGVGTEGRLHDKLWPPLGSGTRKKVQKWPAYVSAQWLQDWLTESLDTTTGAAQMTAWLQGSSSDTSPLFLNAFPHQERTHIEIDLERGIAKDKHLYSTESIVYPDDLVLETAVHLSNEDQGWTGNLSDIHTMGGERRLVHFHDAPEASSSWACPSAIITAMNDAKYVRMMLVTPAFFEKGWQPGWLSEQLESPLFQGTNVKLRLVWACISRWQPISGWSHSTKIEEGREKAVRRLVPAGSVYFFEVIEGNAAQLAEHAWLHSVSDANRRKSAFDHEDGAGLAVWGTWNPDQTKE